MNLIFRGMLFILLDFHITFGEAKLGLIPDWLGCWFLIQGFRELEDAWPGFRKARLPAYVMAVISAVLYILDLQALNVSQSMLLWAGNLAATVCFLILIRFIAKGICHMETTLGRDLQGRKLRELWLYLAVVHVMGALFGWITVAGVLCTLAALITSICYLVVLHGSKQRYYADTNP